MAKGGHFVGVYCGSDACFAVAYIEFSGCNVCHGLYDDTVLGHQSAIGNSDKHYGGYGHEKAVVDTVPLGNSVFYLYLACFAGVYMGNARIFRTLPLRRLNCHARNSFLRGIVQKTHRERRE